MTIYTLVIDMVHKHNRYYVDCHMTICILVADIINKWHINYHVYLYKTYNKSYSPRLPFFLTFRLFVRLSILFFVYVYSFCPSFE
jgi:hypothetical protein